MSWKGEKHRHSMSARGVKTIEGMRRPKDIEEFITRLRDIQIDNIDMNDIHDGWDYLEVLRSIANLGEEFIITEDYGYDVKEVDLWRMPDIHEVDGAEQFAVWYGPGKIDECEFATELTFDTYQGWVIAEYAYVPYKKKYLVTTRVLDGLVTDSPRAAASYGVEQLAWHGGEETWTSELPEAE